MTNSGISSGFVQSPAAKPSNRSKPARESVEPSTSLAEEMVLDTLAEEVVLDPRLDHLMFLAARILDELNSLHQQRQSHITHKITFKDEVRRFEVQMIIRALEQTGGHQTEAARLLQMPVTTLNDKIRRHRIDAAALSTRSLRRLFIVNRKILAPQVDTEL